MSQTIETNSGRSIAHHTEVPWHSLGKKVKPDLSPEQVLKAAGLNWEVRKISLSGEIQVDNKKKTISSGAEMLVRVPQDGSLPSKSDVLTILSSKKWHPVQNIDAFKFFDEIVASGDMEMHTAGSLMNGKHVWALARIKDEEFTLFGGDKVEGYFLFSNPHQYGKSMDIRFTPIRKVSDNALNGIPKSIFRLNHRRAFDPQKAAKLALEMAHSKLEEYKHIAEFLGSVQYTRDSVVEYLNTVFPKTSDQRKENGNNLSPNSIAAKRAFEILETQPGALFAPKSWWNALNAVIYLTDHELGISSDTRIYSAWFGFNQKKKIQAFRKAMEFAKRES